MLAAGLALLTPLLIAPPQDGGAEAMARQLAERSAEQRAQAVRAWQEHGEAWLSTANDRAREKLLERAPAIQEPLMLALWAESSRPEPGMERIQGLLELLGQSMNAAGADRLVLAQPRLPQAMRLAAVEAALQRRSGLAESAALDFLATGRPEERSRALRVLLSHGDPARAGGWLSTAPLAELDLAQVGRGLQALAGREELPAEFAMPEAVYDLRHPDMIRGTLAVLVLRPDRRAETYLGEIAVMAAAAE